MDNVSNKADVKTTKEENSIPHDDEDGDDLFSEQKPKVRFSSYPELKMSSNTFHE